MDLSSAGIWDAVFPIDPLLSSLSARLTEIKPLPGTTRDHHGARASRRRQLRYWLRLRVATIVVSAAIAGYE